MRWNITQDEPISDQTEMGRIRKVVSGLSDNDSLVVRIPLKYRLKEQD